MYVLKENAHMQHVNWTEVSVYWMLTTRQSRMTCDTDASLLPVHVLESALQAAARRTEHLQKNMWTKKKI